MNTVTENPPPKKRGNKLFPIVFAVIIVLGLVFGTIKYVHSLHYEETEDAQIEGNISPVIPKVSGYIRDIRVEDNMQVHQGDTLVILEDKDYQLKVAQARAAYENAMANLNVINSSVQASEANVNTSQANIATVEANIEAAKVNLWQATQDFDRYTNLFETHSVTEQQFEKAKAAKESAQKQLNVLKAQKVVAKQQYQAQQSQTHVSTSNVKVAETNVQMRKTALELAQLQLSYTIITAPTDGIVSQKNIEAGQLVQAGQALFALVEAHHLWVVANFKETQLGEMHPGQVVDIEVDAFPEVPFKGKIASIAAATGAKFSLLPPDNATGNFVKVVQRIPVKIIFDQAQEKLDQLRAGMNVMVEVELD